MKLRLEEGTTVEHILAEFLDYKHSISQFSASEKTSDTVRISRECPNFPGQPGTVRKAPFSLHELIVNLSSFKHSEKRNYSSSQVKYLYPTLSELIYSNKFKSVHCVEKSTE